MTKRAILVVLASLVLLICALSTRGTIFWSFFWVLAMMLALGFISVLWTRATLQLTCQISEEQVVRTSNVTLFIHIRHTCPLPVAALRLDICAMSETGENALHAVVRPFVSNELTYALYCPHVGAYPSGVTGVRIGDVFGLFKAYKRIGSQEDEMVVLPQVYLTAPLAFSPGESDNESVSARAFEDATMPTDLRTFQQGDELKKVHWKLSMRRKEMLVRVYDQPQRPDALLLIDCSPPEAAKELQPTIRDAICEASASLASAALQAGAPIRMPLLTETPVDVSAGKVEDLMMVQDALARCEFDGAEEFERVLMLETRRMRRTGTTAIVTSKLNPALADMILRIRRMGPKVRVLLVSERSEEEFTQMLITRLMRNDVEVEIIEVVPVYAEQED